MTGSSFQTWSAYCESQKIYALQKDVTNAVLACVSAIPLQPAYNLTVRGLHSYYVLAGGLPVLVQNDDAGLTSEQIKSIQSFENLIAEHEQKLKDYLANPDAYDNEGFLKNAPNDEVRQRIIEGRARHLRQEIQTFHDNIDKVRSVGRCK